MISCCITLIKNLQKVWSDVHNHPEDDFLIMRIKYSVTLSVHVLSFHAVKNNKLPNKNKEMTEPCGTVGDFWAPIQLHEEVWYLRYHKVTRV